MSDIPLADINPDQLAELRTKIIGVNKYLDDLDDAEILLMAADIGEMRSVLVEIARRDGAKALVDSQGEALSIDPDDPRLKQARMLDIGFIALMRVWAGRHGILNELGFVENCDK